MASRSTARAPDRRTTRFPPPITAEDFWSLASPVPFLGCWLFADSHDSTPYGYAKVEGTRERAAHRIAYVLSTGKKIPPRRVILHSCDIKGCVNPDHLSVGTRSQNVRDAFARGLNGPRWKRGLLPRIVRSAARRAPRQSTQSR